MSERLTLPGAIDVHVHLREPSTLNKSETIAGGTHAAREGGFVMVGDMPNNPGLPVWSRQRLDNKLIIADGHAELPVGFYAGSQPESDNIGQLAAMSEKAIGLKLYGDPTTGNENTYNASDFAEIVAEWHRVAPDKPIMFHAGKNNLASMISLVAGRNYHPFHVCHVHSSEQVATVDLAKMDGLPVTCGVCPHHLLKTSFDVRTQGAFAEMQPPLADQHEAESLLDLLNSGHIDIVESDFAPHSIESKLKTENEGGHCFGVPGIEHILPLLFYQVKKNRLSMRRFEEATQSVPAEILGLKQHPDTKVEWDFSEGVYRIGERDIDASCGWSPYIGMLAVGRLVKSTIQGREIGRGFGWEPITDRGIAV